MSKNSSDVRTFLSKKSTTLTIYQHIFAGFQAEIENIRECGADGKKKNPERGWTLSGF